MVLGVTLWTAGASVWLSQVAAVAAPASVAAEQGKAAFDHLAEASGMSQAGFG